MNVSWTLRDKVQWATQTGELDAYAKPVFKSMGMISARVNRKVKQVRNQDGAEVVSNTQVHVTDRVLVGDKITINQREHLVLSAGDGLGLYDAKPSFYVLYL